MTSATSDEAARTALRVALLSPCFWPEVRRGGERFAYELGIGLRARGHDARVLTSHPGATARSSEHGLPVLRCRRPPEGRLRYRLFEDHLAHVPLSYAALARGGYDVADAIHVTDALAAARWTERTGRPSVLSYLGIPDRWGLTGRRLRLEITRYVVERCSAVTALSAHVADAFEYWLGVPARVIYPGVDIDAFRPAAERTEAPTVFCAAAIDVPGKRVGLLVQAFARVRRRCPDARLWLSRPSGRTVPPELAGGDLPGVELIDVDDRRALADAYGRAWVSVLPSRGEAFGLVLAEALACGTPGVGTDEGAIPELIDRPEIGRLFSGDDADDLARAVLEAFELAREPATRAACRARAEQFSTARCAAEYEQLYRELDAGR